MSYWEERQKELYELLEEDEEKLKKRMSSYYEKESKKIENKISSYYTQYGENNVIEYRKMMESLSSEDVSLLIEQMDEFANKYPQYAHLMPVRESIYKLNRLEGLQTSIKMQQLEIGAIENEMLTEHLTKQAQRGVNATADALGFGKDFYAINSDIVKSIVGINYSNGKNFSESIWGNADKLSNYLNTDVAQAFARGDSYARIMKNMKDRFETVSRNDMYRLIYTEGTHVMAESTIKPFEEEYEEYKVSTAGDSKVCPICRAMSDKVFKIKDRVAGVNFPPFHPWCRCSFTIYVEDWDDWMDKYIGDKNADQLIHEAKIKDLTITNDLKSSVANGTGKLEGLDFRIKGKDSLSRKLRSKSISKGMSISNYAKKVTDVLRYTNVSESDNLAKDYFVVIDSLNQKGYNLIEVTNTFDKNVAYKGINTLVKDKDGYIFELQFHTPKSLEVKEINHKLYEEQRLDSTDEKRKIELMNIMRNNSNSINIPNGIDRIKDK